MTRSTDAVERLRRLCQDASTLVAREHRARLARLERGLQGPLRVAVAGRVKAGKSTLVNALVGRIVAPTGEGECTQVVTEYRFGAPDRAELFLADGQVRSIGLMDGGLPQSLPVDVVDVEHIVVHLQAGALRHLTLIDTPGLATLSTEVGARTHRLVSAESGNGEEVDAILYVFREAARADDVSFLQSFQTRGAAGASWTSTVGILSQADLFYGRERDPFDIAEGAAAVIARTCSTLVSRVIPVSGLMAETARAVGVSEADARTLSALAEVEEEDLVLREVLGLPPHLDARLVERLYRRLGNYGVHQGRTVASAGAEALVDWLTLRSGVAAVEIAVGVDLVGCTLGLRGARILDELSQFARSVSGPHGMVDLLETARLDPALHVVREATALQALLQEEPSSPLIPELRWVAQATDDNTLVGARPDATATMVLDAAKDRATRAWAAASVATSPAEREAGKVLARTYSLAARRTSALSS